MERLEDPKAAVSSCVSLLAAVTAQSETVLVPWLDLYYQIRRAYEIAQGNEQDPRLIAREDLAPALREMLREELKDTARWEAKKRLDAKREIPKAEIVQPAATKPGPWTVYKRKVMDKLAAARAAGVSIAGIAAASGGVLGEHRVMDAINAATLSKEEWKALERALDQISAAAAEAAG